MTFTTLAIVVAAFSISTCLGWLLSAVLIPFQLTRRLVWAVAPGIGLGICSMIFLVFRRPLFTAEFMALIVLAILVWRRKNSSGSRRNFLQPTALALVLCGALGFAMAGSMIRMDRMPHGGWDAWAIWNTHARVLFRDGPNWERDLPYTFHPDYPLLVPSATARVWRYLGREIPEAGAAVGMIFAISTVAVLAAVLLELTGASNAMLMALMLISTPSYLENAASQYADVPLSFYILSTIGLIVLDAERNFDHRRMLILAGFTAGCAAWTKNEGFLFIVGVCAALLIPVIFRREKISHRVIPFVGGLLPPMAVILFFKLGVPTNDLIKNQTVAAAIHQALDPDRYTLILKYFVETFWSFGGWSVTPLIPLFLYVICVGINRAVLRSSAWLACLFIVGIVLSGYFFVYVATPIPLKNHLESSLDRLIIHLWPSLLLLLGLLIKSRQNPSHSALEGTTVGDSGYQPHQIT